MVQGFGVDYAGHIGVMRSNLTLPTNKLPHGEQRRCRGVAGLLGWIQVHEWKGVLSKVRVSSRTHIGKYLCLLADRALANTYRIVGSRCGVDPVRFPRIKGVVKPHMKLAIRQYFTLVSLYDDVRCCKAT